MDGALQTRGIKSLNVETWLLFEISGCVPDLQPVQRCCRHYWVQFKGSQTVLPSTCHQRSIHYEEVAAALPLAQTSGGVHCSQRVTLQGEYKQI